MNIKPGVINLNSCYQSEDNETLEYQNEYQEIGTSLFSGNFYFNYKNHEFCCLNIIGQIEGHTLLPSDHKTTKYEHIIPAIINFECDNKSEGLLLVLNTVGGDIEAGMAIAEIIAGLSKPTVSIVLGGGHSIGIPLAVSADKTFITKSATMTIHPVRMNGLILGVPQQLAYFQNMQERIIRFVCENSNVSDERFRNLMMSSGNLIADFGTVLDGENAYKEGIADSIGNLSDALNELVNMCDNT